jgi:signal transduction histidine kinase
MMTKLSKSTILLSLFATYIIIQFLWWAYLLLNLNSDYYALKQELYLAWQVVPDVTPATELSKKRIMIFGEGFIFLTLLLIGIFLSARFLRRDFAFARMQRNFLLSISHELKTPIASMQLYLQTLRSRKLEEDKRAEMIDRALSDNQRLQKLVDKLLLATQLENSGLQLHFEPIPINQLIQRSIETANVIDRGNHNISWNPSADITINADEMAVETMVINLLENAVKYAPEGGKIEVSAGVSGNYFYLEVSNEGRINHEEQKLIFSKFYRIGNESTRTTKGTGIGLFLVKSLAALHQGKIEMVQSERQITFKLSLPL